MNKKTNLNLLFENRSQSIESHGGIKAYFDSNEDVIVDLILNSNAVIGCCPWLFNNKILAALKKLKYGSSIVIDKSEASKYKLKQSKLYGDINPLSFNVNVLPSDFHLTALPLDSINQDSVRVFGRDQSGPDKKSLLHYKFLVLCNVNEDKGVITKILPKTVIGGSFNFSQNSTDCRESTLIMENEGVANDFFQEWARAYMLSENIKTYSCELNPEFLVANTEEEVINQLRDENLIIEQREREIKWAEENEAASFDKEVGRMFNFSQN
ncbi:MULTISPECIES: hypothetical protein [unclassified Pseudoalteromonas]|uniref:hypothetical protein n=1 Tax=unclassified Pseudoalteromonas TaxID=194690 RepID=UPI003014CDF8